MKVTVPDQYTGDVMGDLNKRRGRVLGMTPIAGGKQIVEADVPMTELYGYCTDLRSMTEPLRLRKEAMNKVFFREEKQ